LLFIKIYIDAESVFKRLRVLGNGIRDIATIRSVIDTSKNLYQILRYNNRKFVILYAALVVKFIETLTIMFIQILRMSAMTVDLIYESRH